MKKRIISVIVLAVIIVTFTIISNSKAEENLKVQAIQTVETQEDSSSDPLVFVSIIGSLSLLSLCVYIKDKKFGQKNIL